MRPHRRLRASGFGLIELMVVLVIVGLLMAFGLPSFATWGANSRVRVAAESLQNGLRLAQSEAVRRNAAVTFRMTDDSSPDADSDAVATGLNWVLLDADGAVVQVKGNESSTGAEVTAAGPGGADVDDFAGDIVFSGLGRTNLPGTLQFTVSAPASDRSLDVLLTTAGRVRMCDSSRAAGDPQACE